MVISLAAPLLFAILVSCSEGPYEADVLQNEYEYQNGQFLDENDDALLKDYIPVQTPREQRFLEGLIVEAGRHVLFPELYVSDEDKAQENKEKEGVKFYTINGQPEVEESYMNEKTKRRKADCPEDCNVYKPVCGSDGKVYESHCHMLKENCGVSNVTSGPWQICRGKHYLCPSRCLDLNDPVCGSDGRIYHNTCILRKRNCGKLLQIAPLRKCYENFRKMIDMDCPEECPEIYKPVCGSDGVIYYNDCFFRKRTCRSGIAKVDMEDCIEVPKCPDICLPLNDPVCGSDRRLYINQCRMLQENCGKEIKAVANSVCGYFPRGRTPASRPVVMQS